MKIRRLLTIFLVVLFATHSFAANFYVSRGATGSNNGSNWTNAWNEMSQINFSAVSCGDTIWLAGGTYGTTLSVAKNCSSQSALTIKRVLSTDTVPVAAAGWKASYDSQVVIQDWTGYAGIRLNGITNVTIDGRFGNPLGTTPVAYGILLHCASLSSCDGINDGASNNDSTLQNIEVYGPPCVASESCTNNGASGVNLPYGGTGMVFHNLYVHQQGESFRAANWISTTIENSYICCEHNDNIQHEDVLYDNGGSGAIKNLTMRYNKIWSSPNDGIFFDFGGQNGLYFYGNVYYHSGGQLMTFKQVGSLATNIYIYNNVFENDGNFGDYQPAWLDFHNVNQSSGAFENNIMQQTYLANGSPPSDYNAYDTCFYKDNGAHSFCYTSGTQFLNTSASNPLLGNFQLTAAGATTFGKGVTLGAPYNLDALGNIRGTGNTWDIGAYQYGSSAAKTPNPPSQLTGVAK